MEPAAYLRSVCGALVQWHDDTDAAFQAESSGSKDPAILRKDLLQLLDGVQHASDAFRTRVDAAGTPRVAGGERLARSLRDAIAAVSSKMRANRDRFAAIRVTDVDETTTNDAGAGMALQLDVVGEAVQPLDMSPELHQVYESDPDCAKFKHYAP